MIGRATGATLVLLLGAALAGCSAGGDEVNEGMAGEEIEADEPSAGTARAGTVSQTTEGGARTAGETTESETEAAPTASDDGASDTRDGGDPPSLEGADLEAHLAERYEAFWDAYDDARAAPTVNPSTDVPILADLAAGEQLETSHEALIELAEKGEAIREPDTPAIVGTDADAEHRVRIDLIDDSVAEISACVVNDDVRHIVGTGAVVRDRVSTVTSVATMALTDGEWKLIRSRAVDIAEGVTGCWLTADDEYPH